MQKSKFAMSTALAMATLGLGLPHAVTVGANAPDAQQAREAAGQKNEASKGTPARAGATERALNAIFGPKGGGSLRPTYPRPGLSVRQHQRAARKARNVARNRRAHR